MGLNVKIYNIISNGNYTIRYKSGNNPYPVETDSTFTLLGSYTPSTTEVTISGLTFDTQYWIKMTDNTTGRYIVQNIYTHDSKAFPCYDTICFSIDVTCEGEPQPTPTPTLTRTPTLTPTLTQCSDDIVRTLNSPSVYNRPAAMVYNPNNNEIYALNIGATYYISRVIPNSSSQTIFGTFTYNVDSYVLGMNTVTNKVYGVDVYGNVLMKNTTTPTTETQLYSGFTNPRAFEFNSGDNVMYLSSYNGATTGEISVIDGSSETFITQVTGLPMSSGYTLSYNSTNDTLYLPGTGTTVQRFSTTSYTIVGSISVSGVVRSLSYKSATNQLFVIHTGGYDVIDCSTNTVTNSYNISLGTTIYKSVYNSVNNKLYIPIYDSGVVKVIDISTNTLSDTITIPNSTPFDVLLYPSTNTIYVSDPKTTTFKIVEICGSTGVTVTPTPTITLTPTFTPTPLSVCSDSVRNTLSATNSYSAVGRQGMVYSSNNNKAYVLDSNGTTVKSFVPNSTTLTTEFSWSTTSYLLGYNPTENKLYSWQSGFPASMAIRDLDTNTSTTTTVTGITQGLGKIEYNSVLNKIYAFSQTVNFTTAQINVIDGVTNSLTNQITGLTLANVHATVYNPNNNKLYFAQGGKIYSCSGNNITLDVTTLPIISANLISLDVTNDVIYLVSTTTVYKIDATTNTTISMTPITGVSWNTSQLRSMIYNPDNGKLYVSRYSTSSDGFLGVLDPTTGAFTEIISDGISQPLYVPTNTIYGINDTALYEICGSEPVIVSPTPTPTLTRTPTLTPTPGPLNMMGKTSADANDGLTACTNYSSVRGYYAAPGKTLSTLTYGDTIYTSYPSIVENGGGKWVALKTGGVGISIAFQLDTNGQILDIYVC